MTTLKQILHDKDVKVKKLKYQVVYQWKSRVKKKKLLQEHQEIIKYDLPDHPPLLI